MPGAGTDKTKRWVVKPGPVVVLVEPQLGENIGAAARAMANFGLAKLRIVKPVQGWPNERAKVMAAGADRVLDDVVLFDSLQDALADCTYVLATTARAHDQAKPVVGADGAAQLLAPKVAAGETVAIVFGRERIGLENHEVALADAILTLPVNPSFASLNLAQAVIVVGYEWFKLSTGGALPFAENKRSPLAAKQQFATFFDFLERELERVEFFRPEEKRGTMTTNLRNIFNRMELTQQDVRTLHGILYALVQGRKGPASGGVLHGAQAEALRAVVAQSEKSEQPPRGLAKLLRRNPTEAERTLWNALVNDKRFAGKGFKRQTPIGPHIADFVSFPLRAVIDLLPVGEDDEGKAARHTRREWLEQRGYRVLSVAAADIASSLDRVLDQLAEKISP